jgi:predicted CXXCH cytochrome family protein
MRHLNRILGTTTAIVALVGLPVVALAGIEGSAHDLSGYGWTGGEICIVCHTPHNANATLAAPLWNHEVTGVTNYSMYDTSPTLDATDIDQPGETSLLCLSCHDGTVAVDAFGGASGGDLTLDSGNPAYVGEDLSNDHPIGFSYTTDLATGDGGLFDPVTTDAGIALNPGFIADALLFGAGNDQMECASCHDAHNAASVTGFLRKDNTGSDLCLTCHDK